MLLTNPAERALHCVALSPHLDDVAFSLGASLIDGVFPYVNLVNVFSISQCTVEPATTDTEQVTAVRILEDALFCEACKSNMERVYLDRLDAPLRLDIEDEDVFDVQITGSDYDEIRHLSAWLEATMTEHTLLMAPLGLGNHVDHLIVRTAAVQMAHQGAAIAFYEDLPYAGSLPLQAVDEFASQTAALIQVNLEELLIQSRMGPAGKRDVLQVYESQMNEKTLDEIIIHGGRLGGGGLAERLWCNEHAKERLANLKHGI